MTNGRFQILAYLLVFALLLAGCADKSASLSGVFPGTDAFPGWTATRDVELFDRENIYDLVNGQAEAFFVYGFEQVAVRNYENAEGVVLGVEVWQLATPADAYGLFTASISGEPAALGNDGDADLHGFAEAVSAALPSGGEQPALMGQLPSDGLVERSAIFFHEELSIQNEVWLGGENLLGLSPETDCVLARYQVGSAVGRLLLVQYPNAEDAATGLTALEGSQVDALVSANARDALLGAVFGEVDAAAASELLAKALGGK